MSFRSRLFVALAIVGLVPLALTGVVTFSVNREELARTVGRSQAAIAAEVARGCERYVARAIESIRVSVGMLPVAQLSRDELGAVLRIPYAQLEFVRALALFDAHGALLAPPAHGPSGAEKDGRPGSAPGDLEHFLAATPTALALESGTALSKPYRSASGEPRVAVAIRIDSGRVIAAELSLDEIERNLRDLSGSSVALLATSGGEVLAGAGGPSLNDAERALVAEARAPLTQLLVRADGREWLASAAPVPQMGWTTIVAQPASEAFRAAERVRLYTAFWAAVALLLIAALGLVLSRSLAGPLQQLAGAADTVSEGRYDIRLDIASSDEIGRLASAFRSMASAVQRRDAEIRGWNSELQQRVEERTSELKTAQDQMLRARRLAALGALGAGLAHELNNPLTAITGLLTLLRMEMGKESPHAATIQQVIDQSMRVAKIVDNVRRFTESERSQGMRFSLERPVRAALEEHAPEMQSRNIRLLAELAPTCEAQGDPRQIQQVVGHMVRNAIQAMPLGGDLKIRLSDVAGDALKLTISDTGKGIPPGIRERIFDPFFTTKSDATQVGLGLSISHTIVEAHHGRILVDSVEGHGSTFTILLPAAAAATHLA